MAKSNFDRALPAAKPGPQPPPPPSEDRGEDTTTISAGFSVAYPGTVSPGRCCGSPVNQTSYQLEEAKSLCLELLAEGCHAVSCSARERGDGKIDDDARNASSEYEYGDNQAELPAVGTGGCTLRASPALKRASNASAAAATYLVRRGTSGTASTPGGGGDLIKEPTGTGAGNLNSGGDGGGSSGADQAADEDSCYRSYPSGPDPVPTWQQPWKAGWYHFDAVWRDPDIAAARMSGFGRGLANSAFKQLATAFDDGPVIAVWTWVSLWRCGELCGADRSCRSFNYNHGNKLTAGTPKCRLLPTEQPANLSSSGNGGSPGWHTGWLIYVPANASVQTLASTSSASANASPAASRPNSGLLSYHGSGSGCPDAAQPPPGLGMCNRKGGYKSYGGGDYSTMVDGSDGTGSTSSAWECKRVHTIPPWERKNLCPSGKLVLDSFQTNVTIGGCEYEYRAQYRCHAKTECVVTTLQDNGEYGSLRWCLDQHNAASLRPAAPWVPRGEFRTRISFRLPKVPKASGVRAVIVAKAWDGSSLPSPEDAARPRQEHRAAFSVAGDVEIDGFLDAGSGYADWVPVFSSLPARRHSCVSTPMALPSYFPGTTPNSALVLT